MSELSEEPQLPPDQKDQETLNPNKLTPEMRRSIYLERIRQAQTDEEAEQVLEEFENMKALEVVKAAGSTVEDKVGNLLALVVGYSEYLSEDPRLPSELKPMAVSAYKAADTASEFSKTFQSLNQVVLTRPAPNIPVTIDLEASKKLPTSARTEPSSSPPPSSPDPSA